MPPLRFPVRSCVDQTSCKLISEHECLAKTRFSTNGEEHLQKGCDLFTHLWTTCRILQELRRLWAGFPRASLIFPEAEWGAAFHDIGKATPAFITKIYAALNLPIPWTHPIEESPGGHARNSEIILQEFGEIFAELVGSHHGGRTWVSSFGDTLDKEELGGPPWQNLRKQILIRLQQELNLPKCDLQNLAQKKLPLIAGAMILADWLSSGMDLPHDGALPSAEILQKVIANAGLLPIECRPALAFQSIFGFSPNMLQKACENQAKPGNVYVIESGMGSGKTEAALFLAYQLWEQRKINGLYFAMPTKLTSEKIYDRLNDFLRASVLKKDIVKALLIHGEAYLEWHLEEPNEDGTVEKLPGGWFQHRKRALLAPFAAGTADQALMSVIHVRHQALRAFALAGKAVVFDEVHSYDSFTGSLIAVLIRRIQEWGGTVIILSATLTAAAKARLLHLPESQIPSSTAYPLITVCPPNAASAHEIPVGETASERVELEYTTDELSALDRALEHAYRGEQVLWIENTVLNAQKIFCKIAAAVSGIEIGLIHSRFPVFRRREQENYWVDMLGKHGAEKRRQKGRILVATQVLEQSVDVDADFLISRMAPGDMLFQRIGRLWRHPALNTVRPTAARRQMLVMIPEELTSPEKLLAKPSAALPYDSYWMCRTCEEWRKLSAVSVPADIRPVLEKIYAERQEDGALQTLQYRMLEKRNTLEQLANLAQGCASAPLPDERIGTRAGETEMVQVLLLRKGNNGLPPSQYLTTFFDDTPIELPPKDGTKPQQTAAAKRLLAKMIMVPEYSAPRYEDFPTAPLLGNILWTGEHDNRPIRAAYVDESGTLLTASGIPVNHRKHLFYHAKLGYCAWDKEV